ncbi:MAG: tRNA (adenine-N1)-methyltransferase [Anaerolineales bacterium]
MNLVQPGELAMFQTEGGKRVILRLEPGMDYQTHKGIIYHNDVIGRAWGSRIETHLGSPFTLLRPTLRDLLLHIRRQSQIIFPKDIGYILLRLSVGPASRVLEIGTGSGALTTALAWMVGDEGKVVTYERREDMQMLARQNLERVGLENRVDFVLSDAIDGIFESGFDAAFLDVAAPELVLNPLKPAINSGAIVGFILPTTNQVSTLLEAGVEHGFDHPDVVEILLRAYKPIPGRLRPVDRMVAHTGYLVFMRCMARSA